MKIENENIIFLHPGKTGGTSIEFTLRDLYLPGYKFNSHSPDFNVMFGYDKKSKIFLQHANLKNYKDISIDLSKYTVLVSTRRPYERILSCFFYNGKDKKYDLKTFIEQELEKLLNSEFVNHFTPQHTYYQNNLRVIKLENFQQDARSVGLDIKYHYSKTSRLDKIKDRMGLYNQKTKDIIYSLYKEDFLLFGYQK